MKRKIFRRFFALALLVAMVSSITGCYYDDDHDHHWRDGYGRYHYYDRDDYSYRRGDRDDWWRGPWHDHDRDDD